MAPLVNTVEIDRTPEDVFAYVTDPTRFTEWQDSVVSASVPGSEPMHTGSRFEMTRKMGSREQTMTSEITEYVPSSSYAFQVIDGKALGWLGNVFVVVPLVVRRNAAKELPATHVKLKERLEAHQV